MTKPIKPPITGPIVLDTDEPPDNWEDFGYDTKESYEETLHQLVNIPEAPAKGKALEFSNERKGGTLVEWAWKGDSVVIHLRWIKPPTAPKQIITESIVLALNAAARGVQITVKPPVSLLDADGNPISGTIFEGSYTIIFPLIRLRAGSTSFIRDRVVPALLDVNALNAASLRRIPESRKNRRPRA